MAEYVVSIIHGTTAYIPAVHDDVKWTTERSGTPGKLEFTVQRDPNLMFEEGDQVILKDEEEDDGIFHGFVFSKKEKANGEIKVTAYDQLRYFKNKETYVYLNKRADQVVAMVANDFNLRVGSLDNTGYVIPQRAEDNQTLFDTIANALDITMMMTKEMYVLYDDYGKITLKNIANMKTDLLICDETALDYDYESSIDKETYNVVKLYYEDDKSEQRKIFVAKSSANINKWGKLQYSESIQDASTGASKANSLLALHNRPTRNLSIRDAFGRRDIRAGSMVFVKLSLNDKEVSNYMIVEKVTHKFAKDKHMMDLTLLGSWGDYVAPDEVVEEGGTTSSASGSSSGGSSTKKDDEKEETTSTQDKSHYWLTIKQSTKDPSWKGMIRVIYNGQATFPSGNWSAKYPAGSKVSVSVMRQPPHGFTATTMGTHGGGAAYNITYTMNKNCALIVAWTESMK